MSDHLGRLEVWQADGSPYVRASPYSFEADVRALCAECRRLRQDVATLGAIFGNDLAEAGGQFAAGLEHGAARQLEECCAVSCKYCKAGLPVEKTNQSPDGIFHPQAPLGDQFCRAADLRLLGPVRPPLPAERLAGENARLREALGAWLRQVGVPRSDGLGMLVLNHDIARLVVFTREALGAPAYATTSR